MRSTKTALANPLSSTRNPKYMSHPTVKLETPEVTIPSHQNSSDPPTAPAIDKSSTSISKPKSKAYYAIKSNPQEDRSPSPKAPVPRLTLAVREELCAIWKSDPRVPTIASRHAWAVSRNVSPSRVDQWFCSRKSQAKKLGRPISNDSYELSLELRLGSVSVSLAVKRELLSPSLSPTFSDMTDVDTLFDDSLVSSGAYDSDSYVSRRSSVSAMSMTPEPMQGNPYLLYEARSSSPVSRTLTPETDVEQDVSYSKDLYSLAPSPSTYDEKSTGNIPYSEDSLHKVCNQGESDISDFICTLCKPMEGDIRLVIYLGAGHILIRYFCTNLRELDYPEVALDKLVKGSIFPFDTSVTMLPAYARLDPKPDTPMELSAIPYLFCTPGLALAPTSSGSFASWMEKGTQEWTY